MKKEKLYCIFYKDRGKWRGPLYQEFFTMKDIIFNSDLEDESEPNYKHIKNYIKRTRKYIKKPVRLMAQVFKKIHE